MPLTKLFWFLGITTLIFLALQIIGYEVLEIVILLIIIDLVILEVNREMNQKRFTISLKNELMTRVGNIEKIATGILNFVNAKPNHEDIHNIFENKIQKHKDELRNEFKENLDRISKKAIDIENKLHELRRTLGAAVASFDERIKAIEEPEEYEEIKFNG